MSRERFIVSDAKGASDDRKFVNGKCIYQYIDENGES